MAGKKKDPELTLPPYDRDAEQYVLSACMKSPTAAGVALEKLTARDFYARNHRQIFDAIARLFALDKEIDWLTIKDEMEAAKCESDPEFLLLLSDFAPTAEAVTHHAEIVKKKSTLRQVIALAHAALEQANATGADEKQVLETLEQSVYAITHGADEGGLNAVGTHIKDVFAGIEKTLENPGLVTGIPSGFVGMDCLTSGFHPGALTVVAARPAMGKTSFGVDIARHIVLRCGLPVFFFSLEMSREELIQRAMCAEARVDSRRLRTGTLKSDDWPALTQAGTALEKAPLYIDDRSARSVLNLRSACRRALAGMRSRGDGPKALVIVDYLQLMIGGHRTENRQVEIAEISRGLKNLAKDLHVPVLALAQLNRQLEQRQDKRPQLSDLRESGAIEQDADVVAFIYRDEVYNEDTADVGIAEILIRKQRNGPTGDVRLHWSGDFTRFDNLAKEET